MYVCVCVCANSMSTLRGRSRCTLSPLRGTSFGRSAGVCSVDDQSSEIRLFADPDVTHESTQAHTHALRHTLDLSC